MRKEVSETIDIGITRLIVDRNIADVIKYLDRIDARHSGTVMLHFDHDYELYLNHTRLETEIEAEKRETNEKISQQPRDNAAFEFDKLERELFESLKRRYEGGDG